MQSFCTSAPPQLRLSSALTSPSAPPQLRPSSAPAADGLCTRSIRSRPWMQRPGCADKGNQAFWKHEWTCHGICAGIETRELASEEGFFSNVLQLDSQYPLNVSCPWPDPPLALGSRHQPWQRGAAGSW